MTTFPICKMPCKQFVNCFIFKFNEGGGKLEKAQMRFNFRNDTIASVKLVLKNKI